MTTGGEGGMLLLNDPELWKKAWAYKDHGKSYDAIYRREQDPEEIFRWVHESFGTNWRMTEMQSAIGRVQLKKLEGWVEQRQKNAQALAKRFLAIKSLRTPLPNDDCHNSYYKFYTFVRPESLKEGWSRNKIIDRLNDEGVPCFYGSCSEVYREKAFDGTGLQPSEVLSVAQELGETSLMFTVHPTLSESDMNMIADIVENVLHGSMLQVRGCTILIATIFISNSKCCLHVFDSAIQSLNYFFAIPGGKCSATATNQGLTADRTFFKRTPWSM
jgi:dTDP-4-amino-4,6-dideoxygalactose transaminase